VSDAGQHAVHDRVQELAEAGRHEEALEAVRAHLAQSPDDGRALNDAGAVLYALGRFDEAAVMLGRAAACLGPGAGHALWNLAEVYLASGRPREVLGLFPALDRAEVLTADLANRTAAALADRGDAVGAMEALLESRRLAPGQPALRAAHEGLRRLRPKVAFLCEFQDRKFLKDILPFVSARFETRLWDGRDRDEMLDVLRWCDVAWLEWCTGQAVLASQLPKTCRLIVRLHRFEAFQPWPEQVRWEHVDALVTVGNRAVLDRLRQRVLNLERRTRVVAIPNGVNLERFAFRDRPRGKNLACLGYVNARKNPVLLLQALARLRERDPEFRLFFAGHFQDDGVLEDYLRYAAREMGLEGAVRFDGWQDDVAAWLEDKHYLVSASIGEGHPVGVLEGMARGLKPVVHVFPGVRDFLPPQFLWRTADEFCDRILADAYRPAEYRDFVAARFPLQAQLDRINDLLVEYEQHPVARAAAAPTADAFAADQADAVAQAPGGLGGERG